MNLRHERYRNKLQKINDTQHKPKQKIQQNVRWITTKIKSQQKGICIKIDCKW